MKCMYVCVLYIAHEAIRSISCIIKVSKRNHFHSAAYEPAAKNNVLKTKKLNWSASSDWPVCIKDSLLDIDFRILDNLKLKKYLYVLLINNK